MTEAQDKALAALESATTALKRQPSGKPGMSAEALYGQAYQRCVVLGVKPKIKGKYRG